MSDMLNWYITPIDSTVTAVWPSQNDSYDLLNEFILQRLVYGSREYGINLVWDDPDPATPAIRFLSLSGSTSPIRYDEQVAIHVRGGGYLRYGARDYGISLKWSDSPVYEWRLRNAAASPNTPVDLTQPVGLFNIVANDFLFYDPRRYGINLKWLLDKGKYNDKPWYESVTDVVIGFISGLVNLVSEIVNRVIGALDLVLTLLGIMLPKKVRVRIVILRDEKGRAIITDPGLPTAKLASDQQNLAAAVEVIKNCFKEQLNTTVIAAGGTLIETLQHPAPKSALYFDTGLGSLSEDSGDAGRFYRAHLVRNRLSLLGYAAPITVFVIADVEDKDGYSLGPLTDYVLVDPTGMEFYPTVAPDQRPTTAMHELGHACGLSHAGGFYPEDRSALPVNRENLMIPNVPRGIRLIRGQRAIMRNSRHITFF